MININFIFILISGLLCAACQSPSSPENSNQQDSMSVETRLVSMDSGVTEMNTPGAVPFNEGRAGLTPVTVDENIPLYSKADTTSDIKKRLSRLMPIRILAESSTTVKIEKQQPGYPSSAIEYQQVDPWMKVIVDRDTGYIQSTFACHYSFFDRQGHYGYLLRMDENQQMVIQLYGMSQKKMLDTLVVSLGGSDSDVFPDNVTFNEHVGLRYVKGFLNIFRADEYCGGGQFSIYVVNTPGGLSVFAKTGSSGELCDSHSIDVFLPQLQATDTLSVIDKIQDPQMKSKAVTIASSQMVLEVEENTSGYYNEESSDCDSVVNNSYAILYLWDGTKLQLVHDAGHKVE